MEEKSRYWRVTLLEKGTPENWKDRIKDLPVIISPCHKHDVTKEYLQETHPTGYRLHKKDKIPTFWYLFYIGKIALTKREIEKLFDKLSIINAVKINDQKANDTTLKQALRNAVICNNPKRGNYTVRNFETLGGLVWDNGNWTAKTHSGYKWYVIPYYYSRQQLIHYRYWTQKCLKYLPEHADSERQSGYGSGTYETYSEDTVLRIEQKPEVAKIIAKKKKRNTDPTEIKKTKAIIKKRKATIKRKEDEAKAKQEKVDNEKAQELIAKFDADVEHIRQTDKYSDLTILMKYLSIVNHLAKTFELDNRFFAVVNENKFYKQEAEEYEQLAKLYKGENYLYGLKDKLFNKLYHDSKYKDVVKLSAFIPDDPDKVWVNFCFHHDEERRNLHEAPIDFYYENEAMINQCHKCSVTYDHYYYAFYYFRISTTEPTTWHVPYPVGKDYLPDIDKLPQEEQEFNEDGEFLFGNEADADEILFAKHRNVIKPILDFLQK